MAISAPADEARPSAARSAPGETTASLRLVCGHRARRRIELALAGSTTGDWAYATAVTVWAYGVGGAQAVELWAAIRYVLMSVAAPFSVDLADRWPRKPVMIGVDLMRCALVAAAGGSLAVHTPAARHTRSSGHIHVKVSHEDARPLRTQVNFEGDPWIDTAETSWLVTFSEHARKALP